MVIDQHNYGVETNRDARRGGIIATALYLIIIVVALCFARCDSAPQPEEELMQGSILIAFGHGDEGLGEIAEQEVEPIVESPPTPEPEPIEQEIPTTDVSDIEIPTPEADQPEEVVTPTREVNKRALFPGSAPKEESSQGEDEKPKSAAGSERGSTQTTKAALGGGLSGDFDLAGRTLMGQLPAPRYTEQQEGRVVISIMVDESGYVTSASLLATQSTTNNSQLIDAAKEAALKARF